MAMKVAEVPESVGIDRGHNAKEVRVRSDGNSSMSTLLRGYVRQRRGKLGAPN